MNKIVENFQIDGKIVEVSPYGNGHINTTYLVVTETEAGIKRYILQRINSHIFKQPRELMNNVLLVTEHLKAKITAAGGDPDAEDAARYRAHEPCLPLHRLPGHR